MMDNPFEAPFADAGAPAEAAAPAWSSPVQESVAGQQTEGEPLLPKYTQALGGLQSKKHVSKPVELDHRGNINASCLGLKNYFTCGDSNLRKWNLDTGRCASQFKIKDGKNVLCMACSRAGCLWWGRRNGSVEGLDTVTSSERSLAGTDGPVVAIACIADQSVWSLSEEGTLMGHDLRGHRIVCRVSLGTYATKRALNAEPLIEPSDEGQIWVLWLGSVFVVDVASSAVTLAKKLPRSDAKGEDPVTSMTRVGDARWCANASGKVTAWSSDELVGEIELESSGSLNSEIVTMARTQDGLLWCGSATGEVSLVSPAHEKVLITWGAHSSTVNTVFATELHGRVGHPNQSPSKDRSQVVVVTLSKYGSVRLWKVNTAGIIEANDMLEHALSEISTCTLKVGAGDSDIVVLGLQEAVPLNAQQAVSTDTSVCEQWEDYLKLCLERHDSYLLLTTVQLVGVVLCVYVRSKFAHAISGVESAIVKVGFKGFLGNKGAACIRFQLFEDTLLFVCTHLAAGQSDVKGRNEHFFAITDQLHFEKSRTGLDDHDHVVWLGDLNYRIDLSNENVRTLVQASDWEALYKEDQLFKTQHNKQAFNQYREAPISFAPTYKYDHGTTVYDTSKKKRVPAYCDRVLWKDSRHIRALTYERYELLQSDHRPVSADLEVDVRWVDSSGLEQQGGNNQHKKQRENPFMSPTSPEANLLTAASNSTNSTSATQPSTTISPNSLLDDLSQLF